MKSRILEWVKWTGILLILGLCVLNAPTVAAPVYLRNLDVSVPAGFAQNVSRINIGPTGNLYIVGTNPNSFGVVNVYDSNPSYVTSDYFYPIPAPTAVDFVVSGNLLYISTTAGNLGRNIIYEFGMPTSNLVASMSATNPASISIFSQNSELLRHFFQHPGAADTTSSLAGRLVCLRMI